MSQNRYKVKVIQMSLKNNKIAKSGDTVNEAQLNGKPDDLVKGGFITKVSAGKSTDEKEAEAKAAFDKAYTDGKLDAKQLDAITKAEISEYAKKHNLVYDESAKKPALIEQVLKGEKVKE